ncbi:MAG: methionyl-tRNA formyltransferase [Clostridiales bacterium]|nr:methionyl-tRNA formyltransferase [Clostridiales bacterium]
MGTPSFAVPVLNALLSNGYNVVACVTQPDRKRGRGGTITYSEVKKVALKNNISVLQPERIKNKEVIDQLIKTGANLFITCAYGQILSQRVLDVPTYGCINVHASLLPKYRGAAPIHRAILQGEKTTGITTMMTDIGMDTGDILEKREIKIEDNMTVNELHDALSLVGSELLVKTLQKYENNSLNRKSQDGEKATYAPMLKKEDGIINWFKSSLDIHNQIRGLYPWPGCYTTLKGKRVKIVKANYSTKTSDLHPGTIIISSKEKIEVACLKGTINILILQFDNKQQMAVEKCYHNITKGSVLGE